MTRKKPTSRTAPEFLGAPSLHATKATKPLETLLCSRSHLGLFGLFVLTVLSALVMVPHAQAQTLQYWNTAGGGVWSTGNAWSSGNPWGPGQQQNANSSAVAVFNSQKSGVANTATAVTISGATTTAGIIFSNNTSSTILRSASTTTQTLNINNSGIVVASGNGPVTIGNTSSNLTLNILGAQSWNNQSSSLLDILANVTLASPLTIIGSGAIQIDGSISGASAIYMAGTGTLTLTAANTNMGNVFELQGGTLAISNNIAMGTNTVNVFSNATVQALTNLKVTNAYSISNAATATFNVGSYTLTNSGVISGPGSLALVGSGTLALTGTNTYTGSTILNSGTLLLNNASADGAGVVSFASNATIIYGTGMLETNNYSVSNNAVGTLNVASGLLVTNSGIISGPGAILLTNGGTLVLSGANTFSGGLTIGQGTITMGNASALGSSSNDLANNGTLNLAGNAATIDALNGSGSIINTNSSTNTLSVGNNNGSGTYTGTISNGITLTKNGTGTETLTGSNSYSGGTIINAGTLALSNNAALATGALTFASNSTAILALANLSITNNEALSNNGTINNGGFSLTNGGSISGTGSLTLSGVGTTTIVNANSSYSGNLTLGASSVLAISNNASLGSGTFTLTGSQLNALANLTLTNSMVVNSGVGNTPQFNNNGFTLTLSNNIIGGSAGTYHNYIGSGTTILAGTSTVNQTGVEGTTLVITGILTNSGGNIQDADFSNGSTVVVNGGKVYLNYIDIGSSGGAGLGNNGSLNITNGGLVSVGTLNLGNATNTTNGSILVGSNSSLNVASSLQIGYLGSYNSLTVSNGGTVSMTNGSGIIGSTNTASNNSVVITGAGSTWSNSLGTVVGQSSTGNTLTVANGGIVTGGTITLGQNAGASGTLNIGTLGGSDSAGTIVGTITNGSGIGKVNFNETNSATFTNLFSGGLSVSQNGTGTTILTGNNTYTGTTLITNGTLAINGINSGAGTVTVTNSGTLAGSGSITANAVVASGATVNPGSPSSIGTLTISQVSFNTGSTLSILLGGSSSDLLRLSGSGTSSLSGTLSFTTNSALTSGFYTFLTNSSAGVLTNSFASTNSLPVGYILLTGTNGSGKTNSLALQQLAVISPITTTTGLSIITGGFTNFTASLSNSAYAGGQNLVFTIATNSNIGGTAIGSTTLTPQSSTNLTTLTYRATNVGAAQSANFTVSAPSAYTTTGTGTVTVDVYGHAAGGLSTNALALSNVIAGYAGTVNGSVTLTNTNGFNVALAATNFSGTNSALSAAGSSSLTAGSSANLTYTFATGQGTGTYSNNVGVTFGDASTLAGASSNLGSQTVTVTQNVYDHASGSLGATNLVLSNWITGYTSAVASTNSVALNNAAGFRVNLGASNSSGLIGNVASLTNGASTNLSATVANASTFGSGTGTFSSNVAITLGDSSTLAGATANLGTTNVQVTGSVYGHASGALNTNSVTMAYVHAGYSNAVTANVGVSNAAGFRVALQTAATNSSNNVSVASVTGVANNASSNATVTLAVGQGVGAFTNTIGVVYGDNSTLAGANTAVGTNTLTVSGLVYSGQSIWTNSGTGNWTNFGNWSLNGGTPGLDGTLSANDTATFGSAGSGTVTLNTNASLSALTLSNAGSAYTLGGTGTITLAAGSNQPTISDLAGSHLISNALSLVTNVTVSSAAASQITLAGNIAGSGGLTESGLGTTTLSGNNSFSGGVMINGGTLLANSATALAGGSVNLYNGGTLNLGSLNETITSFSMGNGTLLGTGTLTATSFTFTNTALDTISAALGGSGSLTQNGIGTTTLSGNNTYSGGTLLLSGGINFSNANCLGSGAVNLSGGTSLKYSGLQNATFANNVSVSSGTGLLDNVSGYTLTLSGNLSNNGTVLELADGLFNVSGNISGPSAGSDLWLSNATVTLSGTDTYNGKTALFAGSTLNLGSSTALPTSTAMVFGANAEGGSTTNSLNLYGQNQTVSSISNLGSGVNQIYDGLGGGTFTISGNSTFGGSIGGLNTTTAQRNFNVTIAGGNVDLTGRNTYTGTTKINAGATLDLGGGGALTATTNVIVNGGTLLFGGNGRTNSINPASTLTMSNSTIALNGTGATSRTAAQTFASLTLTGNGTIDFAALTGTSAITFGSITGLGTYKLNIFDWNGTNEWGTTSTTGGIGQYTFLYDLSGLSASELANISFYSGNTTASGFLGTGAFSGNQIVPVPEPSVIIAAFMLLGMMLWSCRGTITTLVARRA